MTMGDWLEFIDDLTGDIVKLKLIDFAGAPSWADSWLDEDGETIHYAEKGKYPATFTIKRKE